MNPRHLTLQGREGVTMLSRMKRCPIAPLLLLLAACDGEAMMPPNDGGFFVEGEIEDCMPDTPGGRTRACGTFQVSGPDGAGEVHTVDPSWSVVCSTIADVTSFEIGREAPTLRGSGVVVHDRFNELTGPATFEIIGREPRRTLNAMADPDDAAAGCEVHYAWRRRLPGNRDDHLRLRATCEDGSARTRGALTISIAGCSVTE